MVIYNLHGDLQPFSMVCYWKTHGCWVPPFKETSIFASERHHPPTALPAPRTSHCRVGFTATPVCMCAGDTSSRRESERGHPQPLRRGADLEDIRVFPKIVGFTPKSSILMGFSIIFTIHFGCFPTIFGNTHT